MNIENMLTNGMSGAAGSLLGGIFGAIGAKKQYKRQKSLMKLQSQLEMDNWQQQFDAQNAYNDPSAQLDRLEEAGINPLTQDGGFANTSDGMQPPANYYQCQQKSYNREQKEKGDQQKHPKHLQKC